MDSGAGLANATVQQRIVAVRSFYEFLVEDGLRERNPVRRGQSGRRGKCPRQGLVRRIEQAPWIPTDAQWQQILHAAAAEPVRNRLMVALAYDGALRREELVSLDVGDFEPAYSLIRLRPATTKSKRSREVAYGASTAQLFMQYLALRRQQVGRRPGRLLLSTSRRNRLAPLGASSWSKIVTGLARRAGVQRLSPHTFRHLRLTDLARADWTLDQIAQYAGHQDLSTTLRYIHLSGRELAARFHRTAPDNCWPSKDGINQMLEQLDLTDDERQALEGDRDALAALAQRLADTPTPAGPTPSQLGTDTAFVSLTTLQATLPGGRS